MSNLPVIIAPRVEAEFDDIYQWWALNRSVEQAGRWQRGIEKAILGLSKNAQLHALAPENSTFPIEVRQLLFGLGRRPTHRVLFTIRPEAIYVFELRHVAQGTIGPDDLV